ncbi:MAG: VOC family protein [Spirochaetes bacterium]|nr:VOC family protein [Spirochaetota bacterium]
MIIIESLNYVSISVSDIENSVKFYKDMFEFDVVEKQSGSKEAVLQIGEFYLRLCQIENFSKNSRDEDFLCFTVDEDDFDDILDEVEENSIPVVFGPENIRNGQKIVITDPDGNKIALSYGS